MSAGLINIAIKVLRFLRIKNIEQKKEKFEYELKQYQENAVFVRNNVRLILKTLVTTLIQFLIYYSITYWVYLSFGFTEHNILQLISMQSVLYATVSGIPSPGAVGVSEGAFMQIFRQIYPETTISSAVLLNRGINFYLFVLVSGIVIIINQLRMNREDKVKE